MTERFADHLQFAHDRVMNVEDCFKSCNVFGRLRECHFENCQFRTTENDKLSIHMIDHSPSAEAPPEMAKIQIEHLQEALRKALGTQYRNNIAMQSSMNKLMERRHGLVSPPVELVVEIEEPNQPVQRNVMPPSPLPSPPKPVLSPASSNAQRILGRGRGLAAFVAERENMRRAGQLESPPRYRRTMFDGSMFRAARRVHQHDERLFDVIRAMPFPPCTGRPQYMPLERAVRSRPLWRYMVELKGTSKLIFMGFGRRVEPMTGAIVPTDATAMRRNPVVSGIVVDYHAGSPEAGRRTPANRMQWKYYGILYDVETKPWMILRKVQLAKIPDEGLYQVMDPEREEIYPTEIFSIN